MSHCRACGRHWPSVLEATGCCLFAPEPAAWCGWCGEPLTAGQKAQKRVFCKPECGKACRESRLEEAGLSRENILPHEAGQEAAPTYPVRGKP